MRISSISTIFDAPESITHSRVATNLESDHLIIFAGIGKATGRKVTNKNSCAGDGGVSNKKSHEVWLPLEPVDDSRTKKEK